MADVVSSLEDLKKKPLRRKKMLELLFNGVYWNQNVHVINASEPSETDAVLHTS